MTVWSFLLRLSVVVMLSPVFVSSGQAADTAELLKGLGAKSRSHIRQTIGELGRLNDPAALPALEALGERRLRVDEAGNVYIVEEDGLRAALSGEPVGLDPARLRTPRINNAIRRALRPVIAQLRLGSSQAEVRLAAAEELARRPQAGMIGPLQAALEREQAPAVRTVLAVALAQLQLQSQDQAERLAAIAMIGESGNLGLRPQLEALLESPTRTARSSSPTRRSARPPRRS